MPHLIIEYAHTIATPDRIAQANKAAHDAMIQSGLFTPADIKTRAYIAGHVLVGEQGGQASFVHATVRLLEGRSTQQKQTLSEALREVLKQHMPDADQLSVDIQDMVKDTYRKHVRA